MDTLGCIRTLLVVVPTVGMFLWVVLGRNNTMTIHELKFGERLPVGSGELFTKPIFFGCEDCRDEVDRAHAQLDEAFGQTSGLQQPSHCDSEDAQRACDKADREGWDRVRELAKSIVKSLGVPEILK